MFLRKTYRRVGGKRYAYWALVESHRTQRGPRQRVVAWLGEMDAAGRTGARRAAGGDGSGGQGCLFDQEQSRWVEVDLSRVRVERTRDFGGAWLGLELCKTVGLVEFLGQVLPRGREDVAWPVMALVLVLSRLLDPSSELRIAESVFERSALGDLLGVPAQKVNDDRLYRALDVLLPHKGALELFLKERLGELFSLEYDLLLYDVTSTYFEGACAGNEQASRGYSRDHRPDCKQVCIALVVSRCGLPLGYEVFDGNRPDVTSVQEIVTLMEGRYGVAGRIWVMDRGMVSEGNLAFLRDGGRRYIVGAAKSQLKGFERELLEEGWQSIREGLEVKACPSPDGAETFILCRSAERGEKEKAIHGRFAKRIEEGLEKIAAGCVKRKQTPGVIERRVGALLSANSRAAGLFDVKVRRQADGSAHVVWEKVEAWREWATLTEGCYLLRTNVGGWSASDLWEAYIQLTEAEAAFRIHKSDLGIRPIWHQKTERVQAHILVCFLAYVVWKTLSLLCKTAGLGDEPRKVFQELSRIQMVDVILPTRQGIDIRKRCIARPDQHQNILLSHLRLQLPTTLSERAM